MRRSSFRRGRRGTPRRRGSYRAVRRTGRRRRMGRRSARTMVIGQRF